MRLPSPLLSSLSLSHVAPRRATSEQGRLHRCTTSASEIPDQFQTDLLPQSWLDLRSGRSHHAPHVCEFYEVLHVQHYVVASVLSHWRRGIKIFMTLRSATSSSSSTLVRERNPCVWSTRVRLRISFNHHNITT
jgi:hypothetical protein